MIDNARAGRAARRDRGHAAHAAPRRVPAGPGLRFSAKYLPAGSGIKVGGDWYDVFQLPNGRMALVIGDVVGRGVIAASVMAEIAHRAARVPDRGARAAGGDLAAQRPAGLAGSQPRRDRWRSSSSTSRMARSKRSAPGTCRRCWSGRAASRRSSSSPRGRRWGSHTASEYERERHAFPRRQRPAALHRRPGRAPRRVDRRRARAPARRRPSARHGRLRVARRPRLPGADRRTPRSKTTSH